MGVVARGCATSTDGPSEVCGPPARLYLGIGRAHRTKDLVIVMRSETHGDRSLTEGTVESSE